ncbi:hypothetical protein JCM10207_000990 [Rhodosporidiobolus poonsookiae]
MASSSCTKHAPSKSEIDLASLHLAMFSLTAPPPALSPCGSARSSSRLSDDDLLDSLPSLGQSVVEEAEEQFREAAAQALVFAASPSPSATPGSSSSSSRSRRPTPPADYADPSYFALSRRNLYSDGGDSSYSSSASSCFSASTTPSLYYDSEASSYTTDSCTSSPAPSPFASSPAVFTSNSPSDYFSTASPTVSPASYFSGQPAQPPSPKLIIGVASRRPHASPTALKLDLPANELSSFQTLRGSRSMSFAQHPPSPALSASSAGGESTISASATKRKPRWMREYEEIAGISALQAAAAVEQVNLSRSRERSSEGSPVRLKQRRTSHGFAF